MWSKAIEVLKEELELTGDVLVEVEQMKRYEISVDGCDDSTIVEMELNELELEFLKRFSKLVNETSTYGCMPTIDLIEVD